MTYICIFPLTNLFNFNNILYYKCIYFLNNKYINQSSIHRIPPDIKIDLSFPQSVSSRDYFLTPFLMTLVKKYIIAYSSQSQFTFPAKKKKTVDRTNYFIALFFLTTVVKKKYRRQFNLVPIHISWQKKEKKNKKTLIAFSKETGVLLGIEQIELMTTDQTGRTVEDESEARL